MRGGKKIRIAFYLLAAGGAALFTLLLIRQGAPHVIAAFASAGWWIAAVAIYHLAVPLFLDAIAWWALFPKSERLSLWQLFWMRWIGESVSTLVPSATVGGDVVRARLAALHGAPIPTAAASVLVDITLGVFVQIVFTLLGLGLIVAVTGQPGICAPDVDRSSDRSSRDHRVLCRPTTGNVSLHRQDDFAAGECGGLAFAGAQRPHPGPGDSQALCAAVRCDRMLRSDGHLATARIRRNLDRAPRTFGLQATLVNAVILQSMVLAIRSAVFPVPGALGVQEGGYVVVGNLLGIPGDAAFALSLIARVRELILGIPGLIAWQVIEARRVLRARSAANARQSGISKTIYMSLWRLKVF